MDHYDGGLTICSPTAFVKNGRIFLRHLLRLSFWDHLLQEKFSDLAKNKTLINLTREAITLFARYAPAGKSQGFKYNFLRVSENFNGPSTH